MYLPSALCREGEQSEQWATETQEKLQRRDTLGPTARSLRAGPGLFDGQESKVFQVVVVQATSGVRILPFGEGDRRETVNVERQGQDKKGGAEYLKCPKEFRGLH